MLDRFRTAAGLALALLAIAVAGCDSVVGAECAPGYSLCVGHCAQRCGALGDGGVGDGGVGFGDGGDMGILVGDGATDSGNADTGITPPLDGSTPPACALGQLACSGGCVDGLVDSLHCGACDVVCGSGEVCAAGVCRGTCGAPLVLCGGRCVEVASDARNCGGCGIACGDTGLCIDGACSSALAGHVVVVGHNYEATLTAQDRVAGNALFLARGAPVRTIVFEGTVSAVSRVGAEAAISRTATAIGRAWMPIRVSDASKVPLFLAAADALLVHAQPLGTDADLLAIGAMWGPALRAFLARGGVVVVFDTTSTEHAGTWRILDGAGLFNATPNQSATGAVITIATPADAVAVRVPLRYVGQRTTVHFTTTDGVIVARDDIGAVVVHVTVLP